MEHEPSPLIHMEKWFGWASKLVGAEALGISKVGHTMLARLMEPEIWHHLAGSVCGGFRKWTMVSVRLDVRHFSFSQCATAAFHAATLVMELRGNESG